MSEYPNQPPPRDGWPTQPPRHSDRSDGRGGYGQSAYGQGGGYRQEAYRQEAYRQGGYGQAGGNRQGGYTRRLAGQAGYSDYGPLGSRRTRRRGRGWIALAVTLIVLAVLFVIGDRVAKAYAQNMIAGKLQSQANLSAKPSVTIEGFPFLTQVAAHDVRKVDISASNVPAGKLVISSVNATATGVHLNSAFNGATIDRISGTALITFTALTDATGSQGVTITADPAHGPNAADVSVGPLTATASVEQTGPNKVTFKLQGLGGIASSLIGQLPDYTFTVPKLPAGLRLQGVSVDTEGIVIKVAAHDTTLDQ